MRRARFVRAGIVAGAAVAACKFTPGKAPDGGNVVIVDAGLDAPAMCGSSFLACLESTHLVNCVAGGSSMTARCNWGCVDSSGGTEAHCGVIMPAGGAISGSDTTMFGGGVDDITLTGNLIVNGDDGRIGTSASQSSVRAAGTGQNGGIDYQVRGNVAAFRFKSLKISGTITLISNTSGRAIAFISDGDVLITNTVLASGFCGGVNPGPGGYAGGSAKGTPGAGPGGGSSDGTGTQSVGGGGGGYGSGGGSGPNGNGQGGAPFGDDVISVLVGGGGGGAGGAGGGGMTGLGGGGGGALQIVSNSQIVIMTNSGSAGINAGGCGGLSGSGGNDGGGGGGAGGTILLEAPLIHVNGIVAANGGGGGGGAAGTTLPGDSGLWSRTPAAGHSGGANGGSGGAGSALGGFDGSNSGSKGGGGGGAVGRIRFNSRNGSGVIIDSTAVLSPALTDDPTRCTQGSAAVN
jgi:hypothetical protein